VIAVRVKPVPVFLTTISAPGMTAPLESRTVPEIVALLCALNHIGASTAMKASITATVLTERTFRMLRRFPISSPHSGMVQTCTNADCSRSQRNAQLVCAKTVLLPNVYGLNARCLNTPRQTRCQEK
jgi:hypothetical protein